jgi:5-methylcytosine-specific restriction endonuclease McrA
MPHKDPEAKRVYNQRYNATHRQERRARDAKARQQPGYYEKQRAYYRDYRLRNLAEMRAYERAYYAAHQEAYYRYHHKDWDRYITKQAAKAQRRRAQQHGAAINDFTRAQWTEMKAHYGYRCVYCGKKPQRLTQDHLTPLAKGGNHTKANIVPACQSCNSKKQHRDPLRAVQPMLV